LDTPYFTKANASGNYEIDGLPDGNYTMVVRVNWKNKPDLLGRVETDTLNNWAQVCFSIDNSSGFTVIQVIDDCPIVSGCDGIAYSDAELDCAGNCNGSALRGDINVSGNVDGTDVLSYLQASLLSGPDATVCTDLNADEDISLFDAALLSGCQIFGTAYNVPGLGQKDFCAFPQGVDNINESVYLSVSDIENDNYTGYVDISLSNPYSDVLAYAFSLAGVAKITGYELMSPADFVAQVAFDDFSVSVLSTVDSVIYKQPQDVYTPAIRVFFDVNTESEVICVQPIESVNRKYERVPLDVDIEGCLPQVTTGNNDVLFDFQLAAQPNPMQDVTTIKFLHAGNGALSATLLDLTGRTVRQFDNITSNQLVIQRQGLSEGVYTLRMQGAQGTGSVKIMIAGR
jgi:hypothetical protein